MAEISITDNLGNPLESVPIKFDSASSIFNYLKTELMHLTVLPEFVQVTKQTLTQVPQPTEFRLGVGHDFQLGKTEPEISIGPNAAIIVGINATPKSDLFADDPFGVPAAVPDGTGYVSLSMAGSLDAGASGSAGDLTFGFESNGGITLEFLKAFGLSAWEPTVGEALGKLIAN